MVVLAIPDPKQEQIENFCNPPGYADRDADGSIEEIENICESNQQHTGILVVPIALPITANPRAYHTANSRSEWSNEKQD